MSIRITQGLLYSRALDNIQNGLFRYSQLQQQAASGRRISRPSDDPAAALRILPLRSDLRDLEQLSDNASLARETLETSTASLEDASALMQRVRELTTQASNGTLSTSDRQSIAAEVEQLLGQMVGISNSRRGDRYLFGGTNNGDAPFSMVTDASGSRVLYRGNHDSLSVDVAPGVSTALNIPGDAIFLARNRGSTVFAPAAGSAATGARPVSNGDTGIGFAELQVSFAGLGGAVPATITAGTGNSTALGNLGYTFTSAPATLSIGGGPAQPIPVANGTFTTNDGRTLSLSVTGVPPGPLTGTLTAKAGLSTDGGRTVVEVEDFAATSLQVVNTDTGQALNVDPRNLARTGTEGVKFNGTFDAFTTLIALRDLLQNQTNLPATTVRDRIASMLVEVDSAHDAVLDGLREIGFRSSSMDVLRNRVEGLRVARTESLSLIEDTDIAESYLDLRQQDVAYQASLQVSARIVQTSLLNYLR